MDNQYDTVSGVNPCPKQRNWLHKAKTAENLNDFVRDQTEDKKRA